MKASDNEFPKLLLAEGAAPATPGTGLSVIYTKTDKLPYFMDDTGAETALTGGGGGSGDVVGPASSTDSHVALFDGITGKLLKDGGALSAVALSGDAADVAIADTGGYFTATDAEGALQELGAAVSGGAMTNPMITAGDIITGGSGGTPQRLGVGSEGDVLTIVSGVPAYAAPSGGGAVSSVNGATGAVVLDDGDVKSVVTALTSGTTVTVDCSLGRNFTLTLGHNVGTLTLSNLAGSGYATEVEIEVKQPASGGPYTFALPASFKELGGSDTAIASAANAVTVLSAKTFDNGTTWRYAMQESA